MNDEEEYRPGDGQILAKMFCLRTSYDSLLCVHSSQYMIAKMDPMTGYDVIVHLYSRVVRSALYGLNSHKKTINSCSFRLF